MDAFEAYEVLSKDPKIWSKIKAIAFSYNWDEQKISQQIFRALKEGRVVDSIISIMDECENSSTSLHNDSDNPASDLWPSASSEVQDGGTLINRPTTDSLDGASFIRVSLVETADVSDNVPSVEASGSVPIMGAIANVPIVVSDNVSNVVDSDSSANHRISSAVPSAAVGNNQPNARVGSTLPNLYEQVQALQNENRLLVKQIMCLKCSTAERDSLFMPCGHFIMCSSCSDNCSVCPLCNVTILATSRTRL